MPQIRASQENGAGLSELENDQLLEAQVDSLKGSFVGRFPSISVTLPLHTP